MRRYAIILSFLLLSGCGLGTVGAMALLGAGVAALSSGAMYYYDHQPTPTPTPVPSAIPTPAK